MEERVLPIMALADGTVVVLTADSKGGPRYQQRDRRGRVLAEYATIAEIYAFLNNTICESRRSTPQRPLGGGPADAVPSDASRPTT
jgi:hypothetical protein